MPEDTKEKTVEEQLVKQVFDGEYSVAKSNQEADADEFEAYIDLLDSERSEKEYDWMSDIRIPEFASHVLTQSSLDVGQYFQTRDFVEVYLEDDSDEAKANSEAAKELINRTLNRRDLYHYQKFIRGKVINNISGRVYLKCWWEQETKQDVVGEEISYEPLDVDVYGNPLIDESQEPAMREVRTPIIGEVPIVDQFNYDVYDPRNVFTDNSYVYSLQQKQWVIFRDEVTLQELKDSAKSNGYFNLDKLKDLKPSGDTETSKETYNKEKNFQPAASSVEKRFDRLERYGKFWVVGEHDEDGNIIPGTEKPGIDEFGKPLDNAELHEVIITLIVSGGSKILIGFKLTPYLDANDNPYRPIIRGLCYIHPTEDGGVGDGKYTKELQIAIDDTFNISQDRTMLATLPTLKGRKYALEDNSTVYFEPMHTIELDNPDDLEEFQISDNITGALNQIAMLQAKMQQVDSIQPPTMGQTPAMASTTATAVATAAQGTNMRTNYKSLTFENTALIDLYWMIQQMTWRFAKPETGLKLMGDKIYDFNPTKDYYYKPVSASIESEQSKIMKRKEWATVLGYVSQLQHPNAVKLVNYILSEIAKLMGDEYANFANKLLDESIPIEQGGGGGGQQTNPAMPAVSNQNLLPMSTSEVATREGTYAPVQ